MSDERDLIDPAEWRGDFASAGERMLQSSMAATQSQRLAWLEEALAFAYRVGALKPRMPNDEDPSKP